MTGIHFSELFYSLLSVLARWGLLPVESCSRLAMTRWRLCHCFHPEEMQFDVGLEIKVTSMSLRNVKHIVFWAFTSPHPTPKCQTSDIICLWSSPTKHQWQLDCLTPATWDKLKVLCAERWISWLDSLQCSPSAISETTTNPCLLPVPEKYECFSSPCPWFVHHHLKWFFFFKFRATWLSAVPGSVRVLFFLSILKRKEAPKYRSSLLFQSLWLIIFATSALCLNCGSMSVPQGWTSRYRYITLMSLLWTRRAL